MNSLEDFRIFKNFKWLEIRRLDLLLCVILIFGNNSNCWAQSSLSKWTRHFTKADSTLSITFQVLPPLDTFSQDGLRWELQFGEKGQPIYVFLSISGALLCFKDSVLQHPILVEKNKAFAFKKWEVGKHYKLTVWKCSGPHGFLKVAWFDLTSGENLDEIFVCNSFTFSCILRSFLKSGRGVNIRIAP